MPPHGFVFVGDVAVLREWFVRSEVRGSLQRHLPRTPTDESELFAMRRAVWHRQGIAVLRPADIADDWARQVLINETNRLYGRREGT